MKTALYWATFAVVFLSLFAGVTPWLINQNSSLTLAAVPFLWIGFFWVAVTTLRILRTFTGETK